MKKIQLACVLIAGLGMAACMQEKEKPMAEVINGALANAEQQTLQLAGKFAAEEDVLPRSFDGSKLITADSRWWCSGFFPGVLWYLYENDPKPELLDYARLYTARVEKEKDNKGTHDLGFMLYCSFGNGLRLTGDPAYRDVLLTGAESLSTRYRADLGLIKSWDNNKWQYPVIIDNMMNLELLFWASRESGNQRFRNICISHADRTMAEHYREDFSTYHVVSYDTITGAPNAKQTHQGYSDASAWSRGQAWGLYGYAVMYRETKDGRYLNLAKNAAHFLLSHPNMPADYIPYWDFNAPNIPDELRDVSAGTVICSALIELSGYVDEDLSKEYLRVAETQLRALASPAYTAAPGENGNFILMHSVGSAPHNSEVDVPLTYADYYYVEALLRYKKLPGK
jgi:rhamnogalacturonyl hydrolase YesR